MANKFSKNPGRGAKKIFLLLLLPQLSLAGLFPQAEEFITVSSDTAPGRDENIYSYVEEREGKLIFIQHISWPGTRNVRRYEFIMEQETELMSFREVIRSSTLDTFIEFSVGSGRYRYKVQAYDLLNRPAGTAPWQYLNIIAALQPEIAGFSPPEINLGKRSPCRITVTGQKLSPEAQVFLREKTSGEVIEPGLIQVSQNFQVLIMNFDPEQLVLGSYDIYIRNPGDLEAAAGPFTVKPRERILALSAAYGPAVPVFGNVLDVLMKPLEPFGASARLGIIPIKTGAVNFGLELAPFWNYLETDKGQYRLRAHFAGAYLNLLFQMALPKNTMFINARIGGGISSLLDFHFIYSGGVSDTFNSYYISAGGELSFQWFFLPPLFVEAGAGYSHIFTTAEETNQGLVRPFLGFGILF